MPDEKFPTDPRLSGKTETLLSAAERRDERFERIMMTMADRIRALEETVSSQNTDTKVAITEQTLETKAGFNSLISNNQEMRTEAAQYAKEDKERAEVSQGLQRQTLDLQAKNLETLSDIKVFIGRQTALAEKQDEREEEKHQDRRAKLNELWKQAILPLVIAIVGAILYFLK